MRLLMAGCSCTGVSAIPRSLATPRIPAPTADAVGDRSTYSVEKLGFPLHALFHLQSIESDNSRQVFVEPSRDDPGEVSTF